jgi:fido (protein-threonine AMPylation protein)
MTYEKDTYKGNPVGFAADRSVQADVFFDVLESSNLPDKLRTQEDRIGLIRGLKAPDFEHMLTIGNAVLQNYPYEYAGYAERPQVTGSREVGYQAMPATEDKFDLIKHTLHTAQHKNISTLQDKVLILSYGIQAVHPFADANGRLTRAMYHLLTRGMEDQEILHQTLTDEQDPHYVLDAHVFIHGGQGLLKEQLNSADKDPITYAYTPKYNPSIHNPAFNPIHITLPNRVDSDSKETDAIQTLFLDRDFCINAAYKLIEKHGLTAAKKSVEEIDGKKQFIVDQFYTIASDKDLEIVYKEYRAITKDYVKVLLKNLADPNSSDTRIAAITKNKQHVSLPWLAFGRALVNRTVKVA